MAKLVKNSAIAGKDSANNVGKEPGSSRIFFIWFKKAPAKTNIKNLFTIYRNAFITLRLII